MKVTKTICRPGVSCCDLLIVLAVVGVLCMPLVWKLRQVERQKGAVAWVKAMNGDILYESDVFLCESDVYYPGERRPVFRGHRMKWLSELLGSTYLSTVVCVDLDDHKVTDLSPLTNLPNLRTLRLGDSHQVQDLSPLTKLKNLEHVSVPHSSARDLSPLAHLTNLRYLDLSNTDVVDLSPLAESTNLEVLRLWNTKVADLTPLNKLTHLHDLCLRGTPVRDLAPLAHLTNLTDLNLGDTHVSDLSPLVKLPKLKRLCLNGTLVRDLSPLAQFADLEELCISDTDGIDFSPLSDHPRLKALVITPVTKRATKRLLAPSEYTPIAQDEIARLEKALPNCDIWGPGIDRPFVLPDKH